MISATLPLHHGTHSIQEHERMNRRILISCLLVTCSAVAQTETQEKQRSAVPQDINARFLDKDLDAGEWVNRFEVESREVYANRGDIVAALHLNSGDCIANRYDVWY